ILDSARIPLTDFRNANLTKVRGVRFVFNDSARGAIYITSVRLSRSNASVVTDVRPGNYTGLVSPSTAAGTITVTTGNETPVVRSGSADEVEVELASAVPFHVANDLPRLRVGGHDVVLSRYPDNGDTHHIIFKMKRSEFQQLPDGSAMKVRYGEDVAT